MDKKEISDQVRFKQAGQLHNHKKFMEVYAP